MRLTCSGFVSVVGALAIGGAAFGAPRSSSPTVLQIIDFNDAIVGGFDVEGEIMAVAEGVEGVRIFERGPDLNFVQVSTIGASTFLFEDMDSRGARRSYRRG